MINNQLRCRGIGLSITILLNPLLKSHLIRLLESYTLLQPIKPS